MEKKKKTLLITATATNYKSITYLIEDL